MEVLIRSVLFMICIFIGGYWISDAVREFKAEKYYKFGIDVMLAIYEVILLVDIMFTEF